MDSPLNRAIQMVAVVLATLMLLLLALPVVALILRAIGAGGSGLAMLLDQAVLSAVILSLATTTLSTLLIVILGTPLAYLFARHTFRLKRVFNLLIELPIVLPPVVAGLGLLMAFGRRGLLGQSLEAFGITLPFTTAAVILAQIFVAAPFYIRAAQSRFPRHPP